MAVAPTPKFLWNDIVPAATPPNTVFVCQGLPMLLSVSGLGLTDTLAVETDVGGVWAPLYRNGEQVTVSGRDTFKIEAVAGRYRVVVSGPAPFGSPLVLTVGEYPAPPIVYDASANYRNFKRGGFLWNDTDPSFKVQSASFNVAEAPVRLAAAGLGVGILEVQARVRALHKGKMLEVWTPFINNGRKVALSPTANEFVLKQPGDYRVVVPGPVPFGLPLVIQYAELNDVNLFMQPVYGSEPATPTPPNQPNPSTLAYDGFENTSPFTAQANHLHACDTRLGEFSVSTPANPSLGDTFAIVDSRNGFSDRNALTVLTSGDLLWGRPDDLRLRQPGISVTLRYYGVVLGWALQ